MSLGSAIRERIDNSREKKGGPNAQRLNLSRTQWDLFDPRGVSRFIEIYTLCCEITNTFCLVDPSHVERRAALISAEEDGNGQYEEDWQHVAAHGQSSLWPKIYGMMDKGLLKSGSVCSGAGIVLYFSRNELGRYLL